MDLGQSRRRIEEAVAPATASLRIRRDRAAFRVGLAAGVQALPVFAAILAIGYFGGTFVAGTDLFEPLFLPLLLVLPPFGMALGARAAGRRPQLPRNLPRMWREQTMAIKTRDSTKTVVGPTF